MSLGKAALTELSSVPEMIFDTQRYEWKHHTMYHLATTHRTDMPENSYFKVAHGLRDRVFLTHFE